MTSNRSGLFDPLIIKICGIKTADAAGAAASAGAPLIGLVFVEKSQRAINAKDGGALVEKIKAQTESAPSFVGLFVDADDVAIAAAAPFLDVIQCHGAETPARLAAVKARFGLPVMKALPVAVAADLAAAEAFEGAADAFLFDAKPPKDADVPGGHGAVFDWALLEAYKGATPFLLAGGLTPDNVAAAVTACRGYPCFAGVDVSSGVEGAHGVKDLAKISAFAAEAFSAWRRTV